MIVRLTHAQADGVRKRVSEFHAEQLDAHRIKVGRTGHDFDLPAIAWRQILDHLIATCYGPQGGRLAGRGRPPDSLYLAIRAIADGVRRIEAHPGLWGRGLAGWVGDIIPAFETGTRLWPLDPYPSEHGMFVLMHPDHIVAQGMKVTVWRPGGPMTGSWTFDVDAHRMFVGIGAGRE